MIKTGIAGLCLVLPLVFFACGGSDSKSGDGGFPDLHPENYPEINTASKEYDASNEAYNRAVIIYEDAVDEIFASSMKNERMRVISNGDVQRTSGQNAVETLNYSNNGVTITGTYRWVGSGSVLEAGSLSVDAVITFANYTFTSKSGTYVYNGTIIYKINQTNTDKDSQEYARYNSADLTIEIDGEPHSIKFEEVLTQQIVNGTGTYTIKIVYNIDGTSFGHTSTGVAYAE